MFKVSQLIPLLILVACSDGNKLRSAGTLKGTQVARSSTSNTDEKNLPEKTKDEDGSDVADESIAPPRGH